MRESDHLSAFVKYHRNQLGITQELLASKAGVGLRFIRDLEQGKQSLRIDTINKVLALFGYELRAERCTINAYNIWRYFFNKATIITLKNKQIIYGFIIKEIKDDEQKIISWKIVPDNHAIEWKETRNEKKKKALELTVQHSDIAEIDLQKP